MAFLHRLDPLGTSSAQTLNFLWKDDVRPVYLMDNHRGALWCWLRELRPEDEYSLLHIDWHWDDACDVSLHACRRIEAAARMGLGHFLELREPVALFDEPFRTVRWDNYIAPLAHLRPRSSVVQMIAHQHDTGGALAFAECYKSNALDDLHNVPFGFADAKGRVLVNLDLDFFFLGLPSRPYSRAFSDDFIVGLVKSLLDAIPSDSLWTIAWSPECCGGWVDAASVSKLVCRALGVRCPSEELDLPP